jgi:hypothetical protein
VAFVPSNFVPGTKLLPVIVTELPPICAKIRLASRNRV